MSDVTLSLAVGGVERVAQLGEYIAIKESNVPVDIHVQGVGTMKMQKGEVWRIKGGFDGFTIENYGNVAGTVLMAVGYGDYRAALSVGSLDSINTIVNPVSVQKIIDPLPVRAFTNHVQAYQSSGLTIELVAPALNTKGLIVGEVSLTVSGSGAAALMANAAAPSSSVDNNAAQVISRVIGGWSNAMSASNSYIPAGMGLYISGGTPFAYSLGYEVL